MAWPFSLFDLVDADWWICTVHVAALIVVATFVMGVAPPITGLVALLCYLSYAHRNPAVFVPLDGLLIVALLYLVWTPCGKSLYMLPRRAALPSRSGRAGREEVTA